MLCIYVIVLCNISPIIFIYLFFLEKERVRYKEGGGGGWKSKDLPVFKYSFHSPKE